MLSYAALYVRSSCVGVAAVQGAAFCSMHVRCCIAQVHAVIDIGVERFWWDSSASILQHLSDLGQPICLHITAINGPCRGLPFLALSFKAPCTMLACLESPTAAVCSAQCHGQRHCTALQLKQSASLKRHRIQHELSNSVDLLLHCVASPKQQQSRMLCLNLSNLSAEHIPTRDQELEACGVHLLPASQHGQSA